MRHIGAPILSAIGAVFVISLITGSAFAGCPHGVNCLNNPYGAGSPYKPDV